jgi:DNA-binding MarR family transcriptional regulator
VYCFITRAGLELLLKLDPEVEKSAKRLLRNLSKSEMQNLLAVMEKIRDVS